MEGGGGLKRVFVLSILDEGYGAQALSDQPGSHFGEFVGDLVG